MKELFDVNSVIKKEFSRQIIQMSNFENNAFIAKLDNLSYNDVLDSIIKKIQNSLKNSENLLRKILIDYSYLNDKDYDFISFLIEKIEKLISDNVAKLIRELAKNGYLVSFIFEKEIPEKIKKIIISFIDKINILNSNLDNNYDNYFLNLKIPGSTLLFHNFYNLVKNCKNEYLNKEEEYRKNVNVKKKVENTDEKEITLEDVHFDKKQYIKNGLWNEELLSDDFFNNYYQDIIKDFLYLFFYNKENNSIITKQQEEFLLFLYEERNKNDNLLDRFLYFFLWVGSYHETIFKLSEIINILYKYFKKDKKNELKKEEENKPELLEIIKTLYDIIKFPEEKSNEKKKKKEDKQKEKNLEIIQKERKEKVNGIFYKISESICEIITNVDNIDYTKIENLEILCTDLNKISQIFSQFNITLSLRLKKQYSLISIVKLIEFYVKLEKKQIGFNNHKKKK